MLINYEKQTYVNGSGATPLSAARLNHNEAGTKAAADAVDALGVAVDGITQELGGRLSEAELSTTFARSIPSRLVSTMRRSVEDAVLGVLGDSTGNETTEWIYRLLTWLGTVFPSWTIVWRVWDDTSQAYEAPVTIQAGTGARTLTVYNGSKPGAGANYPYENSSATRFLKMLPVEPTAVMLSFGYNSALPTYRDAIVELSRWVLGYYPKTELIAVAQPPKGNSDSDQTNSLKRSRDVRDVALANGWGLIDAAQAFLDHGNFTADLISSDGIHPNPAGSQVWADAAKRYFLPDAGSAIQRTPTPAMDRIFIPAKSFDVTLLSGGVCEMGKTPANVPCFRFSDSHNNIIAAVADVPPSWGAVNVYALWSTAGGSTNAVVFYVDWMKLTDGVGVPISGFTPAGFTVGAKNIVNSQTGVTSRSTKVYSREPFAGGRPIVFRVRRDGPDAADTTSVEWYFYGLMIERAE